MPFLTTNNLGVENIPIEDSTLTENQTDYDEVLKHQKKYTHLLSMYTNTTRINLYVKIIFKIIFFVTTICIWIYMIHLFKLSFDSGLDMIIAHETDLDHIKSIIDLLAALVPSLVSLITSFIVIPKVIAKYLFNIKEENSMVEIIKSLQSYDDDLYKHRYNEELLAHQSYAKSQESILLDDIREEVNGSSNYIPNSDNA